MEGGQGKLVKQVLTATALAWALAAHAHAQSATGAITVNGRQFPVRHAYASVQPGFFDRKTEDVRVLLTDVPVAEPARGDTFALARLARAGGLHGIEVVVDSKGEPMSGFLFAEAFDGMVSVSGMHRFDRKALERLQIAGRMFTDEPRTFSGVTWQYDVTFSAAIVRPPTAEEVAAALKSPPALAATAHLEAIRKGLAAFVATLTESSAASYRAPGGAARFEEIRAETPAGSRVVSLADRPDGSRTATVQGVRRDGVIIELSFTLRQEGGSWKVER